ncbi:MAG: HAD family hydrolase [Solirubrobacteraceae bacterium]
MAIEPDPLDAGRGLDIQGLRALLFDLDGVITRTAILHAAAWKRLLDDFLQRWGPEHERRFEPFTLPDDYLRYIDGKRRYDGVDAFLRSRAIQLPWGEPSDSPAATTVCGVGNAKNRYFTELLTQQGVDVYDDAVALLRAARLRGLKLAVVSASENCRDILQRVGLLDQFDAIVSGTEAAQLGLAGKPAPDTFLKAAELLGVAPANAVILEDAISGVQAGRAGNFGLVVGVDRGTGADLRGAGADIVRSDLSKLL